MFASMCPFFLQQSVNENWDKYKKTNAKTFPAYFSLFYQEPQKAFKLNQDMIFHFGN